MLKPDSLRAAIETALPELKKDPDHLKIYIDKGRILHRLQPGSFSFEYRYRLNALLINYAGHPDKLMLPLIAWLQLHQPDLFLNHDTADQAITFEVDILDAASVDIAFEMELSETVRAVPREAGGYDLVHELEPPIDTLFDDVPVETRLMEIHVGDIVVPVPA
ncbi:MAG: phage tail protein [Novosphingobium sp.]|nr:phage tail protein [Novosphingobium sp.]